VLGNAQLLDRRTTRSGSLSEREGRSVRVIVDQVVRLNRLIDALLDIGRIERGQLTIQREPVDLGALVRRVTAEFQPALERHELHCIVVGEPLVIDGDELRLEQVLQNLLQNAVKYSPEGGPLEVRAEPCGVQVCVAVADQGLGIPPDAIPHLFDRFYRAGNTRRQQLAGLGIGLFVVREIVTLHGGTIEVASREGQGSVFTVHLPLAADVLATDSPSNASRRAGQAPH
jgi:signal transduction histidine kinase